MAYAALLLYVAILFIRPQEWAPLVHGWPLEKITMALALVTWLGSITTTGWRVKAVPQNLLMLGLFAGILMSHISHTYFQATVDSFQDFGKIVLVFFLVSSLLTSPRRAKGLILVMILGGLFMAWDGITQWRTSTPLQAGMGITGTIPLIYEERVRVRSSGIFHDPNDLALILVTVLPFLITNVWRSGHNLIVRILSAAACVPSVLCVFYTNSRGGWLALGTMLMVYVAIHARRRKLGMIIAVLVFVAIFSLGPSRLGALSSSEESAHERIIAWGEANQMLKANPLFGVGWGLFRDFTEENMVAHNSFAQCWGELGMFGYFFWLALVIASFKDSWALANVTGDYPEAPEYEQLGKTAFASFAGFIAAAMFLSRTYVIPLYVMFGLVAGLRTAYEREHGPLDRAFQNRQLRWVAVAAVVSVPALWLMIRASG